MAAATENAPLPVNNENATPAPAVNEKEQTGQSNGDAVTVFHNPENFNVKHPLMHEWTLWFTKPPSGKVSCENEYVFYCLSVFLLDEQLTDLCVGR